jgi:hypothetical protein
VAKAAVAAYRVSVVVECLKIISVSLLVAFAARFIFGVLIPSLATVEWPAAAHRRGRQAASPQRSIEQIVHDLRRLGPMFRAPPAGTSRIKIEAARYAYDHVLGEAATAVGVEHLLGVLPPGDDRNAERRHVEDRLWLAGLRFEEAA